MKLKNSEFVPYATSEEGSVRINHESANCSGSSNSLKIERKSDGSILAYCFRCGSSGHYTDNVRRASTLKKNDGRNTGSGSSAASRSIRQSEKRTSEWPIYASRWLKQWGLNNEEITSNRIGYSSHWDSLVFPIIYNGTDHGYATRNLQPKEGQSKWYMHGDGHPWYYANPEGSSQVVLVEDIVSAIRVSRYADCIALLTTTISNNTLSDISNYERYIIWLDDDNRLVKLNQLKLSRKLSIFGKVVVVHETDPKRCSDEMLRKYLCST